MQLSSWTLICVLATGSPALAGEDPIVQSGSLSGGKGTMVHRVVLDQFDTDGGTLELNTVTLDFTTAVIGGATTNSSGIPTSIFAQLSADWLLGNQVLAETTATIDTVISNQGPPNAISFFDNDVVNLVLDAPDLGPWIGTGEIVLTAIVTFQVTEDPPGSVGFGAGGSVLYEVTYDFEPTQATSVCTSDPNSSGLAATIGVEGSLDVTSDDTVLVAEGCPPSSPGLFLYGAEPARVPFGNGFLCLSPLAPGIFRVPDPAIADPAGVARHALEFSALPPAGAITAGSSWIFQFAFRDTAAGGAGFDTSNGVRVLFGPLP